MSKMPINIIMQRIKDAPLDSKIAVFKINDAEVLEAVFDSTVETRKAIKNNGNYLGSFWKGDNIAEVRRLLRGAL